MDGWKTTFLWNGPFLGAHVSFRGVNFFKSVTPWWMVVVAFGWNGAGDLSVVSHMPGTMSIQWVLVYPRPTKTKMTKLMNLLVSYISSFFIRVTFPLVGGPRRLEKEKHLESINFLLYGLVFGDVHSMFVRVVCISRCTSLFRSACFFISHLWIHSAKFCVWCADMTLALIVYGRNSSGSEKAWYDENLMLGVRPLRQLDRFSFLSSAAALARQNDSGTATTSHGWHGKIRIRCSIYIYIHRIIKDNFAMIQYIDAFFIF